MASEMRGGPRTEERKREARRGPGAKVKMKGVKGSRTSATRYCMLGNTERESRPEARAVGRSSTRRDWCQTRGEACQSTGSIATEFMHARCSVLYGGRQT